MDPPFTSITVRECWRCIHALPICGQMRQAVVATTSTASPAWPSFVRVRGRCARARGNGASLGITDPLITPLHPASLDDAELPGPLGRLLDPLIQSGRLERLHVRVPLREGRAAGRQVELSLALDTGKVGGDVGRR